MIDVSSGDVLFDDGLRITLNDSPERYFSCSEVRVSSECRLLALGSHPTGTELWGVGLVFRETKLHQVWLQCLNCTDQKNWSLENEKKRKSVHDRYIETMAGVFGGSDFVWGKISSTLDVRGVQALLIVSYK